MKWFHRKPQEPMTVNINHRGLEVTHKIQKMPDPMPVRAILVYTNINGQRFQSYPILINGRSSMRIEVPLSFLTGRDEDVKMYSHVELQMEY